MNLYVLSDELSCGPPFLSQFGACYLLDLEDQKILFDTGTHAEPVLHNMELLGIDPSEIDAIFLSHFHTDHTGGLRKLLEVVGSAPVIAHEFTLRTLRIRGEPVEDFEEIFRNVYVIPGAEDLPFEPPEFPGEISLCVKTKNGLVVVTGCAHSGVCGILQKAQKFVRKKVFAVVGGFHLIGADQERIEKTALWLAKNVDKVFAGHCTGDFAVKILQKALGNRLERLCAGKKLTF